MFYIQLGANGLDVRVKITDENVFTDCPICGEPKEVDITEIDCLYSTEIYCTECFEKQKGAKSCLSYTIYSILKSINANTNLKKIPYFIS